MEVVRARFSARFVVEGSDVVVKVYKRFFPIKTRFYFCFQRFNFFLMLNDRCENDGNLKYLYAKKLEKSKCCRLNNSGRLALDKHVLSWRDRETTMRVPSAISFISHRQISRRHWPSVIFFQRTLCIDVSYGRTRVQVT